MLTSYDVFISYSHHDADWVRSWLLPRLESEGLVVCIDTRDFEIGIPSIVNMENGIRRSRRVLLVMTPNWSSSEWTELESLVSQTFDPAGRKRRLLPIMLKPCDLPARLSIFTYADFTDSAQWDHQLARVIGAIVDTSVPSPPPENTARKLVPNLIHPYAQQVNFTGRLKERQELTNWLAESDRPICELVAIGGMGKSALAWYWITREILAADDSTLHGVMWWSFYESESSFAKFIDDALTYLSGQTFETERLTTTYDRAQELRRRLQSRRVLFVLDGFERQQRAYTGLSAAYKADGETDRGLDARACADLAVAGFIRAITSGPTRAKILITTRLPVSDLEDRTGGPLEGTLIRNLTEMSPDDALSFMRVQGVKGSSAQIAAACAEYGYHPLSLRLLSGLITRDARTPGDIAAAPRHEVHDDLVQRQHHVLEQSYNSLPEPHRTLLSKIAAFRSPMDYDAVAIFNEFGDDADFDAALAELQEGGLLQRDLGNRRYDLHPIVRHYCYDRLTVKSNVHNRLSDYFRTIQIPDQNKLKTIEELSPVIELYHHTVQTGRHAEAFKLFRDRLNTPLIFKFAAYETCIELLQAFFPNGYDQPARKGVDHEWLRWALAYSYAATGQPRRSESLHLVAKSLSQKESLIYSIEIGLPVQQIALGKLEEAFSSLNYLVRYAMFEDWDDVQFDARQLLGMLMAYEGRFDEEVLRVEAMMYWSDALEQRPQYQFVVWKNRALRAVLLRDASAACQASQEAQTQMTQILKETRHDERGMIELDSILGASFLLEGTDLNAAATHLNEALRRCRRVNLLEFEPDILLALGKWYGVSGNEEEAQSHAEEALEIADRSEYRLKQADIHNFLAKLARDKREHNGARHHAEIAMERAHCDGPPHCYQPALQEAESTLRELETTR